jgi:tetratricopeptide (TPR) repeat protein
MNRLQIAVLASALGLFLLLYFTCSTTPPEQEAIEKSRALMIESTDIQSLLGDAKSRLDTRGTAEILSLEADLEKAAGDTARAEAYKALSGKWYQLGEAALAGYYAEEVANLENTGQAWGLAGTTYVLCAQQADQDKTRQFCSSRALKAFENAISLEPETVSHRINLALAFTDSPPADNPMKGILMLRELDTQYPDNPSVLFHLGRLAVQTGQWDRAVERLSRSVELNPDNRAAWCLLAQAYEETGNQAKAAECSRRCEEMN